MTAEGGAAGSFDLKLNQQGNADNQRLQLSMSGLESNATYELKAELAGDTNLVLIADLTADANGAIEKSYVHVGSSKGKGNGGHPGGDPLPAEFNPLTKLVSLAVVNASTVTVLSADFGDVDKLQYLVKRALHNDGVETGASATLRLKSNGNGSDQFRLSATGLTPGAGYLLTINDAIVANPVASDKGTIAVSDLPAGAPAVIDITNVTLADGSTNSVLSTTLP
jgi:hypothetical protein